MTLDSLIYRNGLPSVTYHHLLSSLSQASFHNIRGYGSFSYWLLMHYGTVPFCIPISFSLLISLGYRIESSG
ncbi:hypothetical protein P152DRAFT_38368 [Eremomyces bilateralis CBS 781.70]|uniref:Uncharacterized protein n=1 Tax=Eremomyces bilateralis CBS 781.70 TaxID=1392243 RepID=A0A6G1G2A6_9PEZI|nr:uncharacterized protein P152DRAFT_38368 [Eremomyces bilateralis CBS 781.70]KAF1811939.1 hypothetical protein P152DRAFT_38368 [Eremomyces bilateralis CBS 781.70]